MNVLLEWLRMKLTVTSWSPVKLGWSSSMTRTNLNDISKREDTMHFISACLYLD